MIHWQGIIIHHSADPDGNGLDFDNEYEFHTRVRHWPDIGYHALNEINEGYIINVIGRPMDNFGIHCRGKNHSHLGFCFVGNFDLVPGPSDARILSAVCRVLVPWVKIYNIPLENIQPHREYCDTSCPGRLFRWDKLIAEIKNGLS